MKSPVYLSRGFLALAILVSFVACSSGGGGGGPTAPSNSPAAPQVEFDSGSLINGARADNMVDPQLELRARIADVARQHSNAMRTEGFFAHLDPEGRTVRERLQDAGIGFRIAAENLARVTNHPNPASWAHDQLMASDEHRPNILNPDMTLMGIGVARDGDTYWITQIFIDQ